jgi:hypothetical protein
VTLAEERVLSAMALALSGPRRAAELESIQARLVPDYNDENPGYPESWVSPWRNRSDEEPDEERMDRRWKSFPKRSDKQGDKNMQGSFRRYVKRDFFELNAIFTQGKKSFGTGAGSAARSPASKQDPAMATNPVRMRDGDEGHKATTSEYRVDSADELPLKFDEQDILSEVCAGVSKKFSGRIMRVNQMIHRDKLHAESKNGDTDDPQSSVIVRMCFWYIFVIAWQPENLELAQEFGCKARDAWQRVRVLSDGEAVDLFSICFIETVFQAFPRVFPGNKNTFDDSFCVFMNQIIMHLLFGIVVAPTAVHAMRSTYFQAYFDATRNAGTGGLSEFFRSGVPPRVSPILDDLVERPVALAKSRSEGFYSKNISTSYSACAGPDHPTFMTPGGPGTSIRFVPFNVRKVRVKTIPPVDDYEEPPPPPPPPPPPHIKTAKELNEEYLNEKRKENEDFFKVCHDATVTHIIPDKGHKGNKNFVPGGEIKMTDFSSGKSHHKLPSSLEWAKLREARRKQVYVAPHLRKNPDEARNQLYGLPIPKKKTILEEIRDRERKQAEREAEEKRKKEEERVRANSREATPSSRKTVVGKKTVSIMAGTA